jgi:hypothetical protein
MTTATKTRKAPKIDARALWTRSKDWKNEQDIQALVETLKAYLGNGFSFSNRSMAVVAMQLEEQGLDGMPYVHTRTYAAWRAAGRQVVSKCTIYSVTWVDGKGKGEDEESSRLWPKTTCLYHFSQTIPMEGFSEDVPPVAPQVGRQEPANAEASALAIAEAPKSEGGSGAVVKLNKKMGGVEIAFTEPPSRDVLDKLDASVFRWSRMNKVWYAKATEENIATAKTFA